MNPILDDDALDRLGDLAERHDTFGPLMYYLDEAIRSEWRVGVDLCMLRDVVAAADAGRVGEAMEMLDSLAGCTDYRSGNWQLAAYEAWRRMEWTGRPNAERLAEATDADLLTLGRRIAMLSLGDYRDIDYSRWRTGWGGMQAIASAVLAAHAADDDAACEDLIDILTSAIEAGAVQPPRLPRPRQYGTLGFAGGVAAVTGEKG